MSKVGEAKERQGYKRKPRWPVCGNCSRFTFNLVKEVECGLRVVTQKNMRCSVGGFAVGKTDTCDEHSPKEGAPMVHYSQLGWLSH